jgi:hypothetical protein
MTEQVKPIISQEDLDKWKGLKKQLAEVKEEEMELRKKIFGSYFLNPKEGVNAVPLTEGFVIKGTHKINRDVDPAELNLRATDLLKAGISLRDLIELKPELKIKPYRALSAEHRKLFDAVLVIKPGAPELEIMKPKK